MFCLRKIRLISTIERHIEDLIEPLGHLSAPLFVVMADMAVKLDTLFDLPIFVVALGITPVAVVGSVIAGLVAGNINITIVGVGMVPRGEVGLIFAVIGKSLNVISDEVFSVIVIMVIFTTLLTPPVLAFLLKRQFQASEVMAASATVSSQAATL